MAQCKWAAFDLTRVGIFDGPCTRPINWITITGKEADVPESQAQVRLAHASLAGRARNAMPTKVAREIVSRMHGRRMSNLPPKKRHRRYSEA